MVVVFLGDGEVGVAFHCIYYCGIDTLCHSEWGRVTEWGENEIGIKEGGN